MKLFSHRLLEGEPGAAGGGAAPPAGGGTPPAGGGTPPAGGGTPPPAGGGTPDFFGAMKPELKGYIESKGFKDPDSLATSYQNLEKLIGVPQDRVLKLPDRDDAPEWQGIYERLGKPKDAKEYGITAPEGADPAFSEWASTEFLKANLTKSQAAAIAKSWTEKQAADHAAMVAKVEADAKADAAALKTKWGAAHEKNTVIAQNAAKALGVPPEIVDKLDKELGHTGVMEFFYNVGAKMGEANFVGADGGGFNNVNSPGAAQAKIQTYMKDRAFQDRLAKREGSAVEEWNRLHEQAYPAQT